MLNDLHTEYYGELLKYIDEFSQFKTAFNQSDQNRRQTERDNDSEGKRSRVLIKDLNQQFGSKAPEKLSRLLFMLRENKDVFEVFVNKLPELVIYSNGSDLAEPIVNFMFNDLVSS